MLNDTSYPTELTQEISVPDVDIRRFGTTRVLVTMRRGIYFPAVRFPDYRYQEAGAFTIPLEATPELYQILLSEYKHLKYTIDSETSDYVTGYLERENKAFAYATAEDAPEIPTEFGPIKLRPFQKAAIRYLEYSSEGKILALDMGLGKTAVAIAVAERNNGRTFWVTKSALVPNLDREIRKLTGHKPVILGGRQPDHSTMQALLTKSIRHLIINYEVIGTEITDDDGNVTSRPWVDAVNMASACGFIDLIVADEAHACKNILAKRTQALMRMKAPKKIPMTATPLVNKVKELFPLLNWISSNTFHSEQSFVNTYDDGYGNVRNPKALQKALLPYLFRRAKKDVLKDLPPINRIIQSVSLSPIHKKRYEDALQGVYRKLDGTEFDINSVLAELTRLRQIVASAKADETVAYLENFLEETEGKILVFSCFVEPCEYIAASSGCHYIHGGVSADNRMRYVDDFNNNPDTRILVLSVNTGQEGLNLTAADTILFNDLPWTYKDISQAEGRAYGRLNDLHGALSITMQIDKTVDELMNSLILAKAQRFEEAIEGVKSYATEQDSLMKEFIQSLKNSR